MILATTDITTIGGNYAVVAHVASDDAAFSKPPGRSSWVTRRTTGTGVGGYVSFESKFAPFYKKLGFIHSTPDPYLDADQPNAVAVEWASKALDEMIALDLPPERIVASAEGGVGICFIQGERYADIEFLNNGQILAVNSDHRNLPHVWTVTRTRGGLAVALGTIRDFLRSA